MPRHFANYQRQDPKGYAAFSDNMWNGFVSITKHVPIVGKFFSFTPQDPLSNYMSNDEESTDNS
jgi:hypothetical protein